MAEATQPQAELEQQTAVENPLPVANQAAPIAEVQAQLQQDVAATSSEPNLRQSGEMYDAAAERIAAEEAASAEHQVARGLQSLKGVSQALAA